MKQPYQSDFRSGIYVKGPSEFESPLIVQNGVAPSDAVNLQQVQTLISNSDVVTKVAAQTISALKAVAMNSSFELVYADATNTTALNFLGISITSGNTGLNVDVRLNGEIIDISWNWIPGPVYLGFNGNLTQTLVTPGYVVEIGMATGNNRIVLNKMKTILAI